ncbi:MAG: HlyD family efflux transporter periplasmic adaptor subunit, partial [Cyanobacteria bacterium]|nr:HlyD family efflux transporter periplasmic adaptor subunit [Cyanobacteriota bacterium]
LKAQVSRWEAVTDKRAISQDELTRKRFMLNGAKAQMEKTQADLNRILAGAWIYDIQKADADYWASKAKVTQTQVLLNQTQIKAPRDGEILQVNIRAGEYVADNPTVAPILLGDTHKMQVRVDIDEINASDVVQNMKATASIKGDPQKKFPLEFVRIEPYMVPKKNLSGVSTERVDVRVLQLIYSFNPQSYTTYVGQQVDVFLDKEG